MKTEFELFFEELISRFGFTNFEMEAAKLVWDTQQAKIDKLEHDLGNEKCANRMLQHVLDKEVKS